MHFRIKTISHLEKTDIKCFKKVPYSNVKISKITLGGKSIKKMRVSLMIARDGLISSAHHAHYFLHIERAL